MPRFSPQHTGVLLLIAAVMLSITAWRFYALLG
jgi:hypothetical protein